MKNAFICFVILLLPFTRMSSQAGALDALFGAGGYTATSFSTNAADCKAMAIQPDGRILLGGIYTSNGLGYMAIVRYTTAGIPDATFGISGKAEINMNFSGVSLSAVGVLNDGKIVAAGSVNSKPAILRLTSGGAVDNSFGTAGVLSFDYDMVSILDLKVLAGNKLLGCGLADQGNGKLFTVFRLNADGSPDITFGTNGFTYTDIGDLETLTRMTVQPDGKIILTGTVYANATSKYDLVLARYSANGIPDAGFGTGGIVIVKLSVNNAYEQGNRVAVQADGKIVVAARIANAGPTVFAVTRFNSNGTVDSGFGTAGTTTIDFNSTNDEPKGIAIQSDGKILLVGNSLSGSNNLVALARVNSNGTPDNSFDTDGKVTTAIGTKAYGEDVIVQSDNKIVVAGYATIGGLRQFLVLRYNPGTVAAETPENVFGEMTLFPNPPVDNRLYIDFQTKLPATVRLLVVDAAGRTVYLQDAGQLPAGKHNLSATLPAGLAPGRYVATLQTAQGQRNAGFVLYK